MAKKDFKPEVYENNQRKWTNYNELCKSCGLCIEKCPRKCLSFDDKIKGHYGQPVIKCNIDQCISCGICELNCPDQAIRVEKKK